MEKNIERDDVSNQRRLRLSKDLIHFLRPCLIGFLILIMVGAVCGSLVFGSVKIPISQMFVVFGKALGFEILSDIVRRDEVILLGIRLPRTILCVLVGGGLAISGAALQGLFRNPLADPSLIGVSSGAALAAVSIIVLGVNELAFLPDQLNHLILPLGAFTGGLVATFCVYTIASYQGKTSISTMLLTGIAINALASAGLGFLIFSSDDQQLRDLNFWLLGSLAGVTWYKVLAIAPIVIVASVFLVFLGRHLNALLLGEREAFHIGFYVEKTKIVVIVLVALVTGACVALTGIIGFIGLVVPHLIRLMFGSNNKFVLPCSVILGACLLTIADIISRHIVWPAELPIGILTSCVGGPFFLWLIMRQKRHQVR